MGNFKGVAALTFFKYFKNVILKIKKKNVFFKFKVTSKEGVY